MSYSSLAFFGVFTNKSGSALVRLLVKRRNNGGKSQAIFISPTTSL